MLKCANCSAPLQDLVEQCSFCGTLTDRGVQARQARALQNETDRRAAEQRSANDQARARASAQATIDMHGRWSIIASLVGQVVCCMFPIGPILGVVFGMRARSLAAQHQLPGGALGTAGLTFGVLGLALSLMMWIGAGVLMVREREHRRELNAAVGELTGPQLDMRTACALFELELLDSKYQAYSSLDDVECTTTGALEFNGDDAVLRGAQFHKGDKRVSVIACFHKSNRWMIDQLRSDDDCSAPKETDTKEPKRRKGKRD